jgi:deoxyribodipyrimidine photo-lyase
MGLPDDPARPVILWFRQNLRLADHPALQAALATGRKLVPVYVLDDEDAGRWAAGGAGRWWLHHSLASLAASLSRCGTPLVLRQGCAAAILSALMAETGAIELHAGRMHEPWARAVEQQLADSLGDALHLHRTATLFDLETIRTKTGGVYGVDTPLARTLRSRGDPAPPMDAPVHIPAWPKIASDRLDDWAMLPRQPDWSTGFDALWQPGEADAQRRLEQFAGAAVHGYDLVRNLPGEDGTSMLSPHLHWGELSPNQVWHAARPGQNDTVEPGLPVYLAAARTRALDAYRATVRHAPSDSLAEHDVYEAAA